MGGKPPVAAVGPREGPRYSARRPQGQGDDPEQPAHGQDCRPVRRRPAGDVFHVRSRVLRENGTGRAERGRRARMAGGPVDVGGLPTGTAAQHSTGAL
eukprot:4718399-Prymnesium_polylepis.1